MQSNTVRLFTPREVNAMLPALRPLLVTLADRHAEREQLEELLIEVEKDSGRAPARAGGAAAGLPRQQGSWVE